MFFPISIACGSRMTTHRGGCAVSASERMPRPGESDATLARGTKSMRRPATRCTNQSNLTSGSSKRCRVRRIEENVRLLLEAFDTRAIVGHLHQFTVESKAPLGEV